ncbi:cysteine desulfurase family protein [Georgenia thermotolerans]|uniref:cysteine desulfurase family protein n=1 Tax=Georgenia thermotolerans TaxID=527326 RepID=UPI001479756E|nr:cysteine desulfurase family protein [Georgenia thermotolerans]
MSGTRHYLDHAATTAVRPEAAAAYAEELTRVGNPSSLHAAGRDARRRLEEAREQLAAALDAEPAEVIFTSGGTEADNLAVKGAYWARRAATPERVRLAVSAVEHHAVLEAAGWLAAHEGAVLDLLPVGADGVLDVPALQAHLDAHGRATAVVSVMWANNETGAAQPVERVVALAHAAGVPVHTDAVQAVGHVPVRFGASGVDALSLSGHKLGAPVGVGALLARRELGLSPVEHGGGQERGVRSGTLAVAGARALAAAVSAAVAEQEAEADRLRGLRDRLVAAALAMPGVTLSGPPITSSGPDEARLPGTAHLTIEGADADALLFGLDMAGIAASSGSACQAGVQEASHVLVAMGCSAEQARSALRFSLGWTSTAADVDAVAAALPGVVEQARRAHATRRPRPTTTTTRSVS